MSDLIFCVEEKEYDELCDKIHNLKIDTSDIFIMSIDIGIINLGWSVCTIGSDWILKSIDMVGLVNITEYEHFTVERRDCRLYHTKNIYDWVMHFIQEHSQIFELMDHILIEKQPPQGLVAVEQALFGHFRNRIHLVHPRSMHCYFRIGHYDYDQRKVQVTGIAESYMENYLEDEGMMENYRMFQRRHDICDSICLLLFWISTKRNGWKQRECARELKKKFENGMGVTVTDYMEQFRYHGTRS